MVPQVTQSDESQGPALGSRDHWFPPLQLLTQLLPSPPVTVSPAVVQAPSACPSQTFRDTLRATWVPRCTWLEAVIPPLHNQVE